jgi:hypothetical protein
MKKIAFLFLIIDNPNFPDIWDEYFKQNENKINIYIHPKYPQNHTWKPDCVIKNLQPTKWGFIVDAYMELFKEAFKNKDNYKFITISESCVPIKSFDSLYKEIILNNLSLSFIKIMNVSKYDYGARLSTDIKKKFNGHLIKHYARMCLSKYNVEQLLLNEEKVKIFSKMHVGDEFFLSSITPLKNYKNFAITFDDWEYVDKIKFKLKIQMKILYEEQEKLNNQSNTEKIILLKKKYDDVAKNPKTIIKVSKTDLNNMKNTESFFYRKFDKNSDIKKYINKFIC